MQIFGELDIRSHSRLDHSGFFSLGFWLYCSGHDGSSWICLWVQLWWLINLCNSIIFGHQPSNESWLGVGWKSGKCYLIRGHLPPVVPTSAHLGSLPHYMKSEKSESVNHSVMSNSLWPHGLQPRLLLLGFSVHGILQARILTRVSTPCSRGSSWSRDQTQVSCIVGRLFTTWATREAQLTLWLWIIKPG